MTSGAARPLIGAEVSHYRVLSEIGRGAMGVVYEAEDTRLGRKVALKSLTDSGGDPQAVRRFEREARTASALNHPHICTIHDIGEFDGVPFIVMERLEGQSLKSRMNGQPFAVPELLEIGTQIASALEAAHGKGIVHRDIKPANVFLCSDGAVKLVDFGIAKMVARETALAATVIGEAPITSTDVTTGRVNAASELTTAGALVGTLAYMSPEQVSGNDVDARTDVFAFGVMLYEMAVGRRPFAGATQADLITAVLHAAPSPPSAANAAVPPDLDRLIVRCLEKAAAKRYESGHQLHDALVAMRRHLETAATATAAPSPVASAVTKAKRKAGIDSIAVLPFENRSDDPDADFVSEGIGDSLINSLSELRKPRVVARSLVSRYKGRTSDPLAIGTALGVRAVLTGYAARRGQALVVGAELVDVGDGTQLWGQMYQRTMTDVMQIIGELPKEICEALRLRLTRDEKRRVTKSQTASPRAYELYLRGRFHWNQRTAEGLHAALAYFAQAIEVDPAFAVAHAGIADCYTALCFYDAAAPTAVCPKAKAAVGRALALDPTLAEAHASAGMLLAIWDFEWAESRVALERALELKPGYASAHHWHACGHSALGRDALAAESIARALELEPLSLAINVDAALIAYRAGHLDVAMARGAEMAQFGPGFARAAHHIRGRCALQERDDNRAMAEFGSALGLAPSSLSDQAFLGLVQGRSGRQSEARATLSHLASLAERQFVSAFYQALVHIGLGETGLALERLGAACDERYPQIVYIGCDPIFDPFRSDSRFAGLLSRVGLNPQSA